MPRWLLHVRRQLQGLPDHRDVGVGVARQDLPPVVHALVDTARVDIACDDVRRRARPVLGVQRRHEVDGPPVVGINELLAPQVLAKVGHRVGVEVVHRAGQELQLIGRTGLEAGDRALLRPGVAA